MTLNFAVLPSLTVIGAGCVVIVGGDFTVSKALLLVTLPPELLTVTAKSAPSSVIIVAGVV